MRVVRDVSKMAYLEENPQEAPDAALNFGYKWQAEAIGCLQEAAEAFLAGIFSSSYELSTHCKRVTLMQRDMALLQKIIVDHWPASCGTLTSVKYSEKRVGEVSTEKEIMTIVAQRRAGISTERPRGHGRRVRAFEDAIADNVVESMGSRVQVAPEGHAARRKTVRNLIANLDLDSLL